MFTLFKKILTVVALTALTCTGCGGGGSTGATAISTPATRLVGEIIANADQLASSSLRTNAAYSGDIATSRAIARAGKVNLLDLLFLTAETDAAKRLARLQQYIAANGDLLTSGIRVVVADEVYLTAETPEQLAQHWETIQTAIALVRQHLPQARVGITVSPYATINRPAMAQQTMAYIHQTIALVDWVATDPYWFGDVATVPALHAWSSSFHALAKHVKPSVETWFIAQAFQFPQWDKVVFNQFIAEELRYAEQYDHILFFGWQFVSELDPNTAAIFFPTETRELYRKFLN